MTQQELLLFVPTLLAVSLTPGMCMTLAFAMGLTQGYRHTLWMMAGEMTGVSVVVTTTVLLLSWLMALEPIYFNALALIGAGYLLWIAWQLWHASDHFAGRAAGEKLSVPAMLGLGFTTAVMNPKGWGFMLALLPGFMKPDAAVLPQLTTFLGVLLTTEFLSMSLYAGGGRWLGQFLGEDRNLAILNKVAALLMLGVSLFVLAQSSLGD